MQRRNYSGSIILEQWPHPPSLLNQARDVLKQLLAPAQTTTAARQRRNVITAP